ncbi:DNA polymerase subunit gamma-2, mitochondrial [Scaptodrosophila lebanonensis]|uniref:DNA polymerase subunit gamma-2, mitochondrial n=1 Tax=Drosophila lebanonensis TaxID=7225 RepID=A0A6J2TJK0_DROLE|nr:DNA polymerase subunit gamma-2, mitochondrial [Scaptodrosophila lebanonensis]
MKQLARCLKSLETAAFLKCHQSTGNTSIPDIELVSHGRAYAAQLQQQWLNLRNLAVNFGSETATSSSRLSFVQSAQLRTHLCQLRQQHPRKAKCPTLLKHQQFIQTGSIFSNSAYTHRTPVTHLITDLFVEPHRGLEHFYNMQRESKIWWMRFSSNPSRYAIVPYDLQSEQDYSKDCQAIDIKSTFGSDEITVEQLTLSTLPDDKDFELPDARTGKMLVPAIIRSVLELEPATCALLLDGCDHGRDTNSLLLNRVLAPYQCAIACVQGNPLSKDLLELSKHFVYVLQRAGLRLCQAGEKQSFFTYAPNASELDKHVQLTDTLGVPYTLLLDEQTLQNGLLQLRNRDTKLTETIHISDIPDYLKNIFRY